MKKIGVSSCKSNIINDATKKIKRLLNKNIHVEFAYLFGSRVKGNYVKKSDWDIGIFFKKNSLKRFKWLAFHIESQIAREVSGEVGVLPLNEVNSPVLLFQVIREGLLLVDKNRKNRITFEIQVLRKYHDWKYYLQRQMVQSVFNHFL